MVTLFTETKNQKILWGNYNSTFQENYQFADPLPKFNGILDQGSQYSLLAVDHQQFIGFLRN